MTSPSTTPAAAKPRRRLLTIRVWQRKWLWWMTYLCIGSGVGIFIVKHAIEQDPFSMWNHPSQPWLVAAHLVTSPILIFVIGSLMLFHVIPHFRERDHFWSGVLLLVAFGLYSITGMFLFFLFPDEVLFWIKWTHIVSGFVSFPLMAYHWWVRHEPKKVKAKS
jgi:hypothetical protein